MNSILTKLLSLRSVEHLIIDQDLKILEMSLGVNRFADNPDTVILGEDVRMLFPELIGAEKIIDAIRQGEENSFEFKGIMRSKDPEHPLYIDFCISRNVQNNDCNDELMILLEDATERMLLEQSLVQGANEANLLLRTLTASKQYIDQIVTSMADALLVTTLSGKIKTINSAAQALLEYEEAELIDQPISKVISITPTTLVKEIETVCQTKSGKTIHIAFSCSILQTEIEHFQGYVYILRDMTERKQAELAKQEFLAMISHEVRTPITSITGMASLLLNSELRIEQREFVKTIYTSANALLKIINDILEFSKIGSGKLEIEEQPFNLRTCIQEAVDMISPKAEEKGIKISFLDTPELNTMIVGDITRLRQILLNLIWNATKFTETGKVEISVIISNSTNPKKEIQFAIKDTGIGIPRDRLDRLFKAFSQVDASITRQYGGTGLGLAICKQLSELMGGKIWVESQLGVGSTFNFTITAAVMPFSNESKVENLTDEAEIYPQIDPRLAEQHPLKILIVEDHAINQKIIQMMLQAMGYQPDIANNGLEALSSLRRQPYDAVLMDVQMPAMDGLTATQHICQEWALSVRPRIIAMTASAIAGDSSEDSDCCLACGMDDYLSKPICIQEMMQVLKRCQPLSKKGESKINFPSLNQNSINPVALEKIQSMAEYNPTVNATEFLLEIIDDFLQESPDLIQNMRVALNQGNLKTLQRLAHTFSSSSATLGSTILPTWCSELEAMAATETIATAAEKIYTIEVEYQLFEIALQQEREKYQA